MSEARSDGARPDWYPDPAERFELRYHNGIAWTSDVSSNGRRFVDSVGTAPSVGVDHGGDDHDTGAGRGTAVAALVLGICGVTTAWLPYVFVVGAICAVLAVCFAISALRRLRPNAQRRGAAVAGLVTGSVGCIAAIGGFFFTLAADQAFDDYHHPGPVDASIALCEGDGSFWRAVGSVTNLDDETRDFTVRVAFVRAGTDNPFAVATLTLDDVASSEAREFTAQRRLSSDTAECDLLWVRGPQPFGIAVD